MELKQGKGDKCESRLDQLNGLLQPVLKPSSRSKLSKNEIQEPLLLGHPQTCECVNCIDTTLHNILIRYSLSVAKYLLYVSRPEQPGEALELVHSVCQCAEKKMVMYVQRLGMILCGCACSAPSEGILKETKKKGKAKSAKGKKTKRGLRATKLFCFTVNVLSVFCFILLHLVHLFINVCVPILYFSVHFRPTELDALVFGHLYSVLTGYLSDNSLSYVVRANKNLDNFVVRILREFFQ